MGTKKTTHSPLSMTCGFGCMLQEALMKVKVY